MISSPLKFALDTPLGRRKCTGQGVIAVDAVSKDNSSSNSGSSRRLVVITVAVEVVVVVTSQQQ